MKSHGSTAGIHGRAIAPWKQHVLDVSVSGEGVRQRERLGGGRGSSGEARTTIVDEPILSDFRQNPFGGKQFRVQVSGDRGALGAFLRVPTVRLEPWPVTAGNMPCSAVSSPCSASVKERPAQRGAVVPGPWPKGSMRPSPRHTLPRLAGENNPAPPTRFPTNHTPTSRLTTKAQRLSMMDVSKHDLTPHVRHGLSSSQPPRAPVRITPSPVTNSPLVPNQTHRDPRTCLRMVGYPWR